MLIALLIGQLANLGAVIVWDRIGGRRVHRKMQAQHGAVGLTRAWSGSDGRSYAYCLATGRTIDIATGRSFRT